MPKRFLDFSWFCTKNVDANFHYQSFSSLKNFLKFFVDSIQEQDRQNGLFSIEQKFLCGCKGKGVCVCVGLFYFIGWGWSEEVDAEGEFYHSFCHQRICFVF